MRDAATGISAYERAHGYIGVVLGILDRENKRNPANAPFP